IHAAAFAHLSGLKVTVSVLPSGTIAVRTHGPSGHHFLKKSMASLVLWAGISLFDFTILHSPILNKPLNRGLAALHPDHPKPGTTDGGSDFLLGLARPAAEQEADLMGLQLPEVPARLIDRAFVRFPFTVAVRVHPVLLR